MSLRRIKLMNINMMSPEPASFRQSGWSDQYLRMSKDTFSPCNHEDTTSYKKYQHPFINNSVFSHFIEVDIVNA